MATAAAAPAAPPPVPMATRSVHIQQQQSAAVAPKQSVEAPLSAAGLTLAKMRSNARGGFRRQSSQGPAAEEASVQPQQQPPQQQASPAEMAPRTTRSGRVLDSKLQAPAPAPVPAEAKAAPAQQELQQCAPALPERPPRQSTGQNYVATSHRIMRSPVAGSAVAAAMAALSPPPQQQQPQQLQQQPQQQSRSPLAAINGNGANGVGSGNAGDAKVLSPGVKDAIKRFEAAATPPPGAQMAGGGTPRSCALMEMSAGPESLASPAGVRRPVPPSPGRMFASRLLRGFVGAGAENDASS